jgi:membrane protein implicated in regulation of membrane protease activity
MNDLSDSNLWAGFVTILLITVFLLWLGLKAQKRPNLTGNSTMIGETGVVKKTSGFRDRVVVEVRGEFWWSRMTSPVTGLDPNDLVLIIEPVERG